LGFRPGVSSRATWNIGQSTYRSNDRKSHRCCISAGGFFCLPDQYPPGLSVLVAAPSLLQHHERVRPSLLPKSRHSKRPGITPLATDDTHEISSPSRCLQPDAGGSNAVSPGHSLNTGATVGAQFQRLAASHRGSHPTESPTIATTPSARANAINAIKRMFSHRGPLQSGQSGFGGSGSIIGSGRLGYFTAPPPTRGTAPATPRATRNRHGAGPGGTA
jgi:hypothetical protein